MITHSIRKAYADSSGGQIHYRYMVGTGTPLVLLHQTASSSAMFEKLMYRLAGQRPLYAFDTPGFGGSFDPDHAPSMPEYAHWIAEAIDDTEIGDFHLLGHHTGVCIGAEIAVERPQRVKSFSIIGPVPLTEAEREEFRTHFSTPMAPDAGGNYLKQTWDYLAGLGADGELELHHREILDTARAWLGRSRAYGAVWDQDWTALYQKLDCPLLLMCAEDDVLWPYFQRAQELRQDANTATIGGANFEPDLDPDGVAAAVQAFLEKVSA